MNEQTFCGDGFSEGFCECVEQDAWVRRSRVENIPYLHDHVESDVIRGTFEALTVITKNPNAHVDGMWDIQIVIPQADYLEGPYSLRSSEGKQTYEDALSAQLLPEEKMVDKTPIAPNRPKSM